MNDIKEVSREKWLQARLSLLEEEKALARAADALAKKRRALPVVKVEQDYEFDTTSGKVRLSSLFGDHSQLIVQHFMFGPDAEAGCPICSFWADGYEPMIVHMEQRDTSFAAVSRAPVEKIDAYRTRMGWSFPWLSSLNCAFNFDFHVSATDAQMQAGQMDYNYKAIKPHSQEMHGTSVFLKKGPSVYHTYSTYARGVDRMNAAYGFLDLLPRGRNEGNLAFSMAWVRRHDEY